MNLIMMWLSGFFIGISAGMVINILISNRHKTVEKELENIDLRIRVKFIEETLKISWRLEDDR